MMRRGTTPTIALVVQGYDLTDSKVYATIQQGSYTLTKSGADLTVEESDGNSFITFELTQAETLAFKAGNASVQVRWINSNDIALATDICTIRIDTVLMDGVIAYG